MVQIGRISLFFGTFLRKEGAVTSPRLYESQAENVSTDDFHLAMSKVVVAENDL